MKKQPIRYRVIGSVEDLRLNNFQLDAAATGVAIVITGFDSFMDAGRVEDGIMDVLRGSTQEPGDLGPQPWPCPSGDPHLVFTRRDGTVIPHVGASSCGCPANDKPYSTPLESPAERLVQEMRIGRAMRWLDQFITNGGLLESGVEMEGGIYATFHRLGSDSLVLREQNSLVDAIEKAKEHFK